MFLLVVWCLKTPSKVVVKVYHTCFFHVVEVVKKMEREGDGASIREGG